MRSSLIVLSSVVLAAGGCKRANDKYCDAETPCASGFCNLGTNECQDAPPPDAGVDAGVCIGDNECTTEASPICGEAGVCRGCNGRSECERKNPNAPECDDGRCVECLNGVMCDDATPICADGACALCAADAECEARGAGAAPRCAPDGTCVECLDHADCSSGVCDRLADSCVGAEDIIYVHKLDGSDEGGCGAAGSPCASVSFALDEVTADRDTVSIADVGESYFEDVDVNGLTVRLVGPTGAEILPASTDTPALRARNGADVAIDGLTLVGARGTSPDADGLHVDQSTVSAIGTVIRGNAASGVDASNGSTVVLEQVTVENNEVRGVVADSSHIELRRSTVRSNDLGGLDITDATFAVTNNFIYLNGTGGSSGSSVGGVLIQLDSVTPPTVFEFNTVVKNSSNPAGNARGVDCFGNFTVANNIVRDGTGAALIEGSCDWEYTNAATSLPGTGNFDEDPAFVNEAMDDYHLSPGSSSRDAGDPDSAQILDFDGDRRPDGDAPDVGADEVVE